MDASQYQAAIESWSDEWPKDIVYNVMAVWSGAATDYVLSEGDESAITDRCGSLLAFSEGAEMLADWLMREQIDPYPFWDLYLAIDYHIEDEWEISIEELTRRSDRAVLSIRWVLDTCYTGEESPKHMIRPTRDTKKVIKSIQDGLDNDAVAAKHGINVSYARTIRSRLKKGEYYF